jgi:small subunit ribosomal protein S6
MKYELLYIVPTQYTDAEVETVKEKVAGMIAAAQGTVSRNESVGKLKLAYPIKKVRHGTYVLVRFESEPKAIAGIERQLRLTDEVLRHQVIQLPNGVEDQPFQMISYVAPLSEEARADEQRAPAKPSSAPTAAPAPVKREEVSLSIEELDKKLDEILETDVTKNV